MADTPRNRYFHEIGRLVFARTTRKYASELARVSPHSIKRLLYSTFCKFLMKFSSQHNFRERRRRKRYKHNVKIASEKEAIASLFRAKLI